MKNEDTQLRYKFDGSELRGRRKDKAIKKLTESRVRRNNKINPNNFFE